MRQAAGQLARGQRNSKTAETVIGGEALPPPADATIELTETDLTQGQYQLGPFTVIKTLGAGGKGTVYLVRAPQSSFPLALKVLDCDLGSSDSRRGDTEIRSLVRLSSHSGVVNVVDTGEVGGKPFILMELVTGGDLEKLIERNGPLDPLTALKLIRSIGQSLAYAHSSGVVHRDLKPANILLRQSGEPVLSDFGLAKITRGLTQGLTDTGETLGTPAFMAPEQLYDAKLCDARTDIYGLGAILYNALTGEIPYPNRSPQELYAAIVGAEPPTPSELQPDLPEELDEIVQRCMEKLPVDRYQDMDDVLEILDRSIAELRWPKGTKIYRWPSLAAMTFCAAAMFLIAASSFHERTSTSPTPATTLPKQQPAPMTTLLQAPAETPDLVRAKLLIGLVSPTLTNHPRAWPARKQFLLAASEHLSSLTPTEETYGLEIDLARQLTDLRTAEPAALQSARARIERILSETEKAPEKFARQRFQGHMALARLDLARAAWKDARDHLEAAVDGASGEEYKAELQPKFDLLKIAATYGAEEYQTAANDAQDALRTVNRELFPIQACHLSNLRALCLVKLKQNRPALRELQRCRKAHHSRRHESLWPCRLTYFWLEYAYISDRGATTRLTNDLATLQEMAKSPNAKFSTKRTLFQFGSYVTGRYTLCKEIRHSKITLLQVNAIINEERRANSRGILIQLWQSTASVRRAEMLRKEKRKDHSILQYESSTTSLANINNRKSKRASLAEISRLKAAIRARIALLRRLSTAIRAADASFEKDL